VPYPESLRDDLPRTETYPLGRQGLDAALTNAGVEPLDLVYFLRAGIEKWKTNDPSVVTVDFGAPWARDTSERIEVRVHAVPSEVKPAVETALRNALPQIADWIREAERAENVWRSSDHTLVARWNGEALMIDVR